MLVSYWNERFSFNASRAAERRYARVKRWLRDVDIFSKDYLIIPINQTAHWYIVLVQFHNRVLTEGDLISDDENNAGKRSLSHSASHRSGEDCWPITSFVDVSILLILDDRSNSNRKTKKEKQTNQKSIEVSLNNGSTTEACSTTPSNSQPIGIADDLDETPIDASNESEPVSTDLLLPPKTRSPTPAIIMFDSLRAGSKSRVAATLREFLQLEYDHRKTLPVDSSARKVFNLETIPTIEAAVPQQPNYFDCGLYILQYIENFFTHRTATVNFQSATTFANWCDKTSMGSSKRKQIFDIINEHVIGKQDWSSWADSRCLVLWTVPVNPVPLLWKGFLFSSLSLLFSRLPVKEK